MLRFRPGLRVLGFVALLLTLAPIRGVGQDFDNVEITSTHVAGAVHMLRGAGGNIGVCAGDDGVFLIDDQYAPLTEKIRAAVAKIQDGPIRFVLNTHWHSDHTGGNENFGSAGTIILSHDNVRARLSTKQLMQAFGREVPASPEAAWPMVTFTDAVTLHLNDEEIHAFHVPPAHTDGDAVVHFRRANVVHMGDVYFNGMYPFIDVSGGGSIRGVIEAVERVLEMSNADTRIIPGHGALSNRAELEGYRAMLVDVRDAVLKAIRDGVPLDKAQGMNLTATHDEAWGNGFINPGKLVEILYSDLQRK